MKRSGFGAKFTRESGILRLMDDLGEAASADAPVLALGGGNWRHRNECLRINYAGNDSVVRRGLDVIAEEIRAAFR